MNMHLWLFFLYLHLVTDSYNDSLSMSNPTIRITLLNKITQVYASTMTRNVIHKHCRSYFLNEWFEANSFGSKEPVDEIPSQSDRKPI